MISKTEPTRPIAIARHSPADVTLFSGLRPAWVPGELFPFTSRWVDVGGARLHYIDEGSGPLLLMVHGSPMWSFMYRRSITRLRSEFRCVAVDLAGLGLSEAPIIRGREFAQNADWLQGFVTSLQLSNFTLVVHATGGPPALEMAVREKKRVERLVISNTFAWPLDTVPKLRWIVKVVSSSFFGFVNVNLNLLPRLTVKIARRTGRFSEKERAAILGPYRRRETRLHLQNFLRGIRVEREMFTDLEERLSVFRKTPTLFLYGAHDNGYKAGFLEHWKKLLPCHQAIVLSEAGHFPLEDSPDDYTSALQQWWGQCVK